MRAALEARALRGALPPVDLPEKDVRMMSIENGWCGGGDGVETPKNGVKIATGGEVTEAQKRDDAAKDAINKWR